MEFFAGPQVRTSAWTHFSEAGWGDGEPPDRNPETWLSFGSLMAGFGRTSSGLLGQAQGASP